MCFRVDCKIQIHVFEKTPDFKEVLRLQWMSQEVSHSDTTL